MDDKELNARLAEGLADVAYPHGLDSGKAIPYVGWFWRYIDFTDRLSLYYPSGSGGFDVPVFFGFMQNNKWDYDTVSVNDGDRDAIRAALVNYVNDPCEATAKAAWDKVQDSGVRAAKGER